MDKETLFKAIQRREVVLWAGAGFSRYAGFPMGAGVVHHLFDTLSKPQQEQVRSFCSTFDAQGYPAMGLPAFASLFVNLHNGQPHTLRREIYKLFSARPKLLKTHQQLAQIPFIEHVVTTNYDSLFEQAYGTDKLHVVTSGKQLPYQEYGKTTLYKVHGSLENLDSLLITEDDYHTFYAKSDRVLWNSIESLMVSRTLLFVGYGLEDPNVVGLFMQLLDALGGNMRNAYLVAPGLHQLNIDRLARRNVTYIDATGEELVEELLQSLKDTTLPAARQGGIALDHTAQFLRNLGLQPTIQPTASGFEVTDIKALVGRAHYKLDFVLNQLGREMFRQFEQGVTGLALKLDATALLACDWKVEGINMGIDIKTLWVVRAPQLKKTVDIEFSGGLVISDVSLSIYAGEEVVTLLAYTPRTKLIIRIPAKEMTERGFEYSLTLTRRQDYYDSVESGLEHSRLMQALGRREAITCYENGNAIWHNESGEANMLLHDGENLEKLMTDLQRIERAFGIRFRRFLLTDQDARVIHELNQVLLMESHLDTWSGHIDITVAPTEQVAMLEALGTGSDCIAQMNHKQSFDLMNWQLEVAYQTMRRLVGTKARKLKKDFYRFTSTKKQLETYYNEGQKVNVLKQGIPQPIQSPPSVELPDEITQHLLDKSRQA
jgi:hypothetical protein